MTELDSLADRLRADLPAFADPGTAVSLNRTAKWLQASWQQRGRLTTANFAVGTGQGPERIRVRTQDRNELTYPVFLAGDRMGDLRSVARNTIGAIRAVPAFVPPRACLDEDGRPSDASQLLDDLAGGDDPLTKLVFITADAGVGKTSLLTEMVRRKAKDYALGHGGALWLYVNAQGSRLAKLDQALAAALDDVRAPFPYHAAAPLVRSEALVLVIDGFDELIGAPGTYDDAFSSLASFLRSLDGEGTIIATSRSAYYEQEFLARVGTIAGFAEDAWSLRRLELSGWNENERAAFLHNFGRSNQLAGDETDRLANGVLAVFDEPNLRQLVTKPFFVARVAQFAVEGRGLEPGASFLDRLVNTYIAREVHGKLLSSVGGPVLTEVQLATLYQEIANEMWREETRELSRTSFKELVDVAAEILGIPDEARELVVDRLPNSALVHSGTDGGSVAFEHEIFFSYFLAKPIVEAFATGDPFLAGTALRRGRLPIQAGDIAGRTLVQRAATILETLSRASTAVSMGGDQVRQNAGAIVAGMMRAGLPDGSIVANVDFVDLDLARVSCSGATFRRCSFRGVDLRGATFTSCAATQVEFTLPLLDPETVIDVDGLETTDFHGLTFYDESESAMRHYSPDGIERVLAAARLPASSVGLRLRVVGSDELRVVDEFIRIFERTNIASLEDEFIMRRVVRDASWPKVFEALLKSGVCAEEIRQTKGNKSFVRMLVRPGDLLAGLLTGADDDPRITDFWDSLQTEAPGK
jgi:hypothetical protein